MPGTVSYSVSGASEDSSSAASSDAESEATVELLVKGRAKRTTAGTRINSLIQKEKDELVDLVFEKEEGDVDSEEDVDFVGDEDDAGSDAQLDSSSDDEDQGPGKADGDLEGEEELQKQVRAERQKKRKARAVFKTSTTVRKKVKVDPTAVAAPKIPTTPASRHKKKSERVSWIPTSEEGPVRASSRKQTMQNKETVHLRMAEKEKQRLKQMKHMEEAEKRRQAAKAPPMTQAQRMAEAARTERKNAKSLNRWEEAEKSKAEVQKAKLEALHNRQLMGPVISWWSGLARWVNGKLSQVGMRDIKAVEESEEQPHHTAVEQDLTEHESSKIPSQMGARFDVVMDDVTQAQPKLLAPPSSDFSRPTDPIPRVTFAPPLGPGGFLEGIHYYASLPSQPEETAMTATTGHQPSMVPNGGVISRQPPKSVSPVPIEHPAAFVEKPETTIHSDIMPTGPCQQPSRPSVEYSSRNLVALRNIDSNATSLPELQASVLLKRRSNKLHSQYLFITAALKQHLLTHRPELAQEHCAITGGPARFRDPKTGLAYSDSYAFKEIQRLRTGGSRWSSLLGCYVGSTTAAARGVPERFRRL